MELRVANDVKDYMLESESSCGQKLRLLSDATHLLRDNFEFLVCL